MMPRYESTEPLFDRDGEDHDAERDLADCKSYGDVMQRLAYWAMLADVEAAFADLPEVEKTDAEEPTQ